MLQSIKFIACLVIIIAPNLAHAAKASGKVLCVKTSGEIVVKNKCKKSETKLSSDTLIQSISLNVQSIGIKGPQGPTGPLGSPGPAGASGLAGVPGPKGTKALIDFSGCRVVSSGPQVNFNQAFEVISEASATVSCNPNSEFIFNDSFVQAPLSNSIGTRAVIKTRISDDFTIAGDKREFEVTYFAERVVSSGNGIYSLTTNALCCPR